MSDDTSNEAEIFVKLSLGFKAIRVIENRLIPTSWDFCIDVIYDDLESNEYNPNDDIELRGSFAKIRYWFENIVDGSILFSRDNDWALNAFVSNEGNQIVHNNILLLPDEPTDEVLAQVFQSKMNALGGGNVTFGSIEISSDDNNGLSFLFTGISELNLPPIEEWIGERSFFSKPWWGRDDASTIDVIPNEDANLDEVPEFAVSLDFIVEQMRPHDAPKGQIIRREFRPTIIQGGK